MSSLLGDVHQPSNYQVWTLLLQAVSGELDPGEGDEGESGVPHLQTDRSHKEKSGAECSAATVSFQDKVRLVSLVRMMNVNTIVGV